MKYNRICNFNAGPATLPLPVLEEIQESFLNFKGSGMSITEISHRSKWFDEVINSAVERSKRLLGIGDNYHVLFLHGGASMQYAMIPMNFLAGGRTADFINTGTWSTKAIKEAAIQKTSINVVASSEDKNFTYIPENINFSTDASFVHYTSNNTIKGTQWHNLPDTGEKPLVSDMCSDIFSRPLDMEKFGMIYAGAQKNIGPSGLCLVVIRDDMLEMIPDDLPTMLSYKTFAEKNSMFNTPPCFPIYTVELVLKWLEEEIGGLENMEKLNIEKAKIFYDFLDSTDFYNGTAVKKDRSLMNVTFRLQNTDLEKQFIAEALENGFGGLSGHKSVGGCRASIYNAMKKECIESLIGFMKEFERING